MSSVRETFCDTLDQVRKVDHKIDLVVVLRHWDIGQYTERLTAATSYANYFHACLVQPFGENTLEEAQCFVKKFVSKNAIALVTHRYHIYRAYLTLAAVYNSVPIVPIAIDPNGLRDYNVETQKIKHYQKRGDILSYTAGLRQLKWHFTQ